MTPTTITSYNNFVAGTKAKSSEMTTNLDNHRGTLLPINPDTSTASDNTHDLGQSDHRWRNLYLGNPPTVNGTTLSKTIVQSVFDGSVAPSVITQPYNAGVTVIGFSATQDEDVFFSVVVPPCYVPGNRVGLNISGACETSPASLILHSFAVCYKNSVSSLLTTASSYGASTTVTPSAANRFIQNSGLYLSDTLGSVNGVTLSVGDMIGVVLKRAATQTEDTNAGYFYLSNIEINWKV